MKKLIFSTYLISALSYTSHSIATETEDLLQADLIFLTASGPLPSNKSIEDWKESPYNLMTEKDLMDASYNNKEARNHLIHKFFNDCFNAKLEPNNPDKLLDVIWAKSITTLSFEEIHFAFHIQHTNEYFNYLAIPHLQESASQGEPKANYTLGTLYNEGIYFAKDWKKAVPYYKIAAKKGLAVAQAAYGGMYEDGFVIQGSTSKPLEKKRFERALKWYKRAAIQGHVVSQWIIGKFNEEGTGTPINIPNAIEWYKRGAELGDSDCVRSLKELGIVHPALKEIH